MGGLLRFLLLSVGASLAVRAATAFLKGYLGSASAPSPVKETAPPRPPLDERDIEDAEFEELPG